MIPPAKIPTRAPTRRPRLRKLWVVPALVVLGALAWTSLWPVKFGSREEVFEIPPKTWARRMAGEKREILPSEIRLVLGMRDVLVLRNLDEVPQIFGPTLIMPGQSFRLPFDVASEYQFACTAHASGEMRVLVDEAPVSPWSRMRWRAKEAFRWLARVKPWAPRSA